MKIKTSATPEWFFQSDLFQLETNSSNINYNSPKKRIHDYSTFPTYTAPSNKITGHPEYDYAYMKNQENNSTRIDPGQQVGYNVYPKMTGVIPGQNLPFLNAYNSTQQIAFKFESGSINDGTLNLGLGTDEKYQWINGEQGIGYFIFPNETLKIQRVNDFLNQSRQYQPNSKFGIYSLQAFSIWDEFYHLDDINVINQLCDYLINPPDSIQALVGCDYLMEDIYSQGSNKSQFYGAMAIYQKQLARKKFQQTGLQVYNKLYYLLWSHSENFGYQFRYKKNDGSFITVGELDGLSKAPSNINLNYNLALAGVTIADGFWHFIDRFCSFGTNNFDGTNKDLEVDNVNHSLMVNLRNQIYTVGPSIIWLGVNQYSALAIWHAYLQRDIIEDTTYEWFTPDFIYNNNLRTDKYKEIPYNLYYKEPTVQAKYNANKSECLLYVCNFDSENITQQLVTVKLKDNNNNDVNVPVVLKGTKAELVRVTF